MGESDWRKPPREFAVLFQAALEPVDCKQAEQLIEGIESKLSLETRKKLEELLRNDAYARAKRRLLDVRGPFARAVTKADEGLLTIIRTLRDPGSDDLASEYRLIVAVLAASRDQVEAMGQEIANTARISAPPPMDDYHKLIDDLVTLGTWTPDDARILLRACGFPVKGPRPH